MSSDRAEIAGGPLDAGCSPISRRDFVARSGLVGMAVVFAPLRSVVRERRWGAGKATEPNLVHESLDGLAAYVVPGADVFSVAQGVSTSGPGAVAARATDGFIEVVDALAPVTAPGNSATVAAVLNALAGQVDTHNSAPGFRSPFAGLSFDRKHAVFARLERDPSEALRYLAAVAPALIALLTYSEYGVLDRHTHQLRGRPVGWRISHYGGTADGHDELRGYYRSQTGSHA
jgi:hypothetical protein